MIQRMNECNNKYFTCVYTGVCIHLLIIPNCNAIVINVDLSICNRNINLGLFFDYSNASISHIHFRYHNWHSHEGSMQQWTCIYSYQKWLLCWNNRYRKSAWKYSLSVIRERLMAAITSSSERLLRLIQG